MGEVEGRSMPEDAEDTLADLAVGGWIARQLPIIGIWCIGLGITIYQDEPVGIVLMAFFLAATLVWRGFLLFMLLRLRRREQRR